MINRNIKRIYNDIKKIEESKFDDIFIHYDEADMQKIKALIIGPKDSAFAGGFFYFSLDFTNFPINPPKVKFLTPHTSTFRCHPNLYACGKVCLSILNTWGSKEWSPLLEIDKILITIQALLDNNPIANEPGFEKNKPNSHQAADYSIMSRYLMMKSCPIMLTRQDIPAKFITIMKNYISQNKELYESLFAILDNYKDSRIKTIHGNYTIKDYQFNLNN